MNDEELTQHVLEAWPASEPPPDFADRVLQRESTAPRAAANVPRRWWMAAVAMLVVLAGWGAARFPRVTSGERTISARETIALGRRGLAVAEPGAHLAWHISNSGHAEIAQPTGAVFYRVEPGGPFVVTTPAGNVTVTGTCFRVEIEPMRNITERGVSALAGAALASAVLVTVYEGHVRVDKTGAAPATVELGAGEQARIDVHPPEANRTRENASAPALSVHSTNRGATTPPSLEQLEAQNVAQQARIAELEKKVAQLEPSDAFNPAGPFGKVRGFSPEELKSFATSCELHMGLPEFGLNPPTLRGVDADRLAISASERDAIDSILSKQNAAFLQSLTSLYVSVTGDKAGAGQLDVPAMVNEIEAKSRQDELAAARREISQENAGLAKAPADLSGEPAATRLYRLMNGADSNVSQALTDSLGAAEAKRVQDSVLPRLMVVGGCPDGPR